MINDTQELRDLGKKYTDAEFQEIFKSAAKLFREEKVIITPLFCKNLTIFNSLNQEAQDNLFGHKDDANWSLLQINATLESNTVLIDEKNWIMGGMGDWDSGYNLLDTGIDGWAHSEEDNKGILDFIKPEYREFLVAKGLDRIYLRIGGGIRELVVFNPAKFNDLVNLSAMAINAYMDKAKELGIYYKDS